MTDIRLKTFPQMSYYDAMASGRQISYAMLSGPISYESQFINTDIYGFRKSIHDYQKFSVSDLEQFESVNFLIGGSTVFGVGAKDDSTTISSLLSQKTNEIWINLGLRGGVSFQEMIHLLNVIRKAKKINHIIFFSGINDIYTNFLHTEKSLYDHAVNEVDLDLVTKSLKRQIFCHLFSKIHSCRPQDLINLSLKEIIFGKYKKTEFQHHDPVEQICQLIQRNFLIYKSLQSIVTGQVGFVLQPFFPWTQKKASTEEDVVMKYLDQLQAHTVWPELREAIANTKVYDQIKNCYIKTSEIEKIKFVDSHAAFNQPEALFVDSVHLTDLGNQIACDIIFKNFCC